jgi:hypothetical protein
MKKYYKQGSSYFELNFDNEKMTCVTENMFNKGIVVSEGMTGPFMGMANSFSSSVSMPAVGMGEPVLESNEDEFTSAFKVTYDMITSASFTV